MGGQDLIWPLTNMGKSAFILAGIGLLLEFWLLSAMWKRRLVRAFPFFSVFIFSAVVTEIIRAAVAHDYVMYFKVFWGSEVLSAALALLALREAFQRLFEPFLHIYSWSRFLFPVAVIILAGIPLIHGSLHPPREASSLIAAILSFELGVSLLQCGLFVFFLLIKQIFRISWRTYSWGIVEGFAPTAIAGIAYAARSEFGTRFEFLAKYGTSVAYILALLLWLDTFTRASQDSSWRQQITPDQLMTEIRSYSQSLRRLLEKKR